MNEISTDSAAARVSAIRDLLPTTLGTAELRDQIAAEVRARSVFVARGASVVFLSRIKEVIDAVAGGQTDKVSARAAILETLRALGYTPEGGFPEDASGQVPEAVAGTLQDLTSHRRLNLIVDTQVDLMAGRGSQLRGMEPDRMAQFPALELVRVGTRRAVRDWQSRWTIAGGTLTQGRMIAFKGDPVWGELGASGNFDDALDVDHPPFAFNSGMGWREIDRAEVAALGLRGPDGQTPAEWLADEHPVLSTMPPAQLSVADADPALLTAMTQATPDLSASGSTLSQRQDRLAAAIARRRADYEKR